MGPNSTPLLIEKIAAESEKFTAPLLFVHGLWTRAAAWRRFMGYCAHRGWTCHALNLVGAATSPDTREANGIEFALHAQIAAAVASCTAPPVIVGHDLGGLLVLQGVPGVRAAIALAPLLPISVGQVINRLCPSWKVRLAEWRSRALLPSPPRQSDYFGSRAINGVGIAEWPQRLLQLARQPPSIAARCAAPTLIVGGGRDSFAPASRLQDLAAEIGADFHLVEDGNHALPWDTGWEKTIAPVHRWIVQNLGESLLIPREEEDD